MAASMENDVSALQADIQQLRADFAKMTTDISNLASNGYAQATKGAQQQADRMWGEVRRQAQNVTQEIEERPFASALVSFATGLVLGMLLNARRG